MGTGNAPFGVNTQPDGQGMRFNSNKPILTLVLEAAAAMAGAARVFMYGMEKYDRSNWMKGMSHTDLLDSALRHQVKWLGGEDYDEESGEHHIDHALTNLIMLSEMVHSRPDLDNRPSLPRHEVPSEVEIPEEEPGVQQPSTYTYADLRAGTIPLEVARASGLKPRYKKDGAFPQGRYYYVDGANRPVSDVAALGNINAGKVFS